MKSIVLEEVEWKVLTKTHSREDNFYYARLAEQCDRWNDMMVFIIAAADFKQEFILEERNLLSVALKNYINNLRCTWRKL